MQFVDAVNRIFRQNGILRGDTDDITTFSDTAHSSTIQLARLAVENELVELVSDRLIPKERKTTGSLSLMASTRTYSLATDFVRFYGTPHLYDSANGRQVYEYDGGLEKLQTDIFTYATQTGYPAWWYWEPGNTTYKQIGFFLVPDGSYTMTYDYEASVLISAYTDNLPFHNDEEDYTFCEMAGRRFKFMFEDTKNEADIATILYKDLTYKTAKARLMNLLKGQNPSRSYGFALA